jgi:hypothetical protein
VVAGGSHYLGGPLGDHTDSVGSNLGTPKLAKFLIFFLIRGVIEFFSLMRFLPLFVLLYI